MASFDYRLNPLYTIKECSSCGALYNKGYCCSNMGSVDKFVRDPNPISYDETPDPPSQPETSSFNQRHCFHCKDPLEEHERCQRCTCKRCWSGLSQGFCHICNEYSSIDDSTIESLNDNPNFDNTPQEQSSHYQDPSENFAQNFSECPPQINQNFCYGCGDSLDDFFCQRCTCEFCGNGAHYGYDCPPQVPFVYNPEPCYDQNYDEFPQTSPSFPQQYPCCEDCGGPHMTYECQPMNYYEPDPCYDSNYSGFDQIEPPQYSIDRQPQIINQEWISDLNKGIIESLQSMFEEFRERQQAANINQSPP
ncbi:hypothetical protein Tco_1499209 [Tanacetum coccineum]